MPFIMRTFDARLLVATGTLFFVASCWINVGLTHDVGMDQLILPQLLRAIGRPLFSIPLSQLSTAGLSPRDTADASSLSNMMRNLGGSIGIASLSTMIDRREHVHFSALAEGMIALRARRTDAQLRASSAPHRSNNRRMSLASGAKAVASSAPSARRCAKSLI